MRRQTTAFVGFNTHYKSHQLYYGRGKKEISENSIKISTSTTETILRKIIELGQQGRHIFFGEKSFAISDLMRIENNKNAYINIFRLKDIQDKPKLFSTFMLDFLAEIYQQIPE